MIAEQPENPQSEFVSHAQYSDGQCPSPSRGLLIRNELVAVVPLLVGGQHHGDAAPKRKIVPRDVKTLSVLVRPRRTDAGPDFLAGLVFPCGLAVVEDIGWRVWHILPV